MSAVIHAMLTVTSAPVDLVKRDGTRAITVTAREDDDQGKRQLSQLFGPSEKSRRTIAGRGPGDAVIQVNAVDCSMQLPTTPKPKPRKPRAPKLPKPGRCGGGTPLAAPEGV